MGRLQASVGRESVVGALPAGMLQGRRAYSHPPAGCLPKLPLPQQAWLASKPAGAVLLIVLEQSLLPCMADSAGPLLRCSGSLQGHAAGLQRACWSRTICCCSRLALLNSSELALWVPACCASERRADHAWQPVETTLQGCACLLTEG